MLNIEWNYIVEAMKIAASGNLGVIALIVVAMSIVGIVLFRKSSDQIKAGVFVFLAAGICSFAYATMQITANAEAPVNEQITANAEAPDNEQITANAEAPDNKKLNALKSVKVLVKPSTRVQPSPTIAYDRNTNIQGYVYLGTFTDGKWSNPRFKLQGAIPSIGDVIKATSDRPLLKCAPFRKNLFSLKYSFCNEKARIASGERVTIVEQPDKIGLNRIWAKVQYGSHNQVNKDAYR